VATVRRSAFCSSSTTDLVDLPEAVTEGDVASAMRDSPDQSVASLGGRERRVFRLTIEYDGTDFAGFQLQGKGERTVQGELEAAITLLSGEPCRVHGAGRTDAGVHATGQVVHFASGWQAPPDRMAAILNGTVLPRDLVVRWGRLAEPGFHARYSATARVYRYAILNRSSPSALHRRYAYHVRDPLDLAAMTAAAAELVGTRDFAAFGLPTKPGYSTVRVMERIAVRRVKDCVFVTVRGNAFLKKMVRALVGTLVKTGLGRMTAEEVGRLRDSKDWTRCPSIAPPHGLCLVRVDYSGTRIVRDNP
jgi:tRNA pseudouridine38-40 synthase